MRSLRMAAIVTLVLAWSLVSARLAWARSYTMDSVSIEASVATDGTLSVREEREFDFDGSFHGVYWNIPTGTYQGRDITTTITGVGEMINGSYVGYEQSDSGANHTYELTKHADYVQVKVYTEHEDDDARVVVSYTDANLATRYDDTAELYWKFVSDGWDEESRGVICTIHLPVPDGVSVVGGENVRAWGHGPLDASVSFVGNDVVYTVPGVGTNEYAEARIAFPADWLTDVTPSGTAALDGILAEEQAWADEANERRAEARATVAGITVAGGALGFGLPALAVVVAILRKRRYRRAHAASFADEYFRDVPSDDHPAVLGALYHDGKAEGADLTASLMRLSDMGCITLEPVTYTKRGRFGREKQREDYRLTRREGVPVDGPSGTLARGIDEVTIDFIFHDLTRLARHKDGQPDDGSFYFSEMADIAKHSPERYHDAYKDWTSRVEAAGIKRQFYVDEHKVGRALPIFMGTLSILGGIGAFLVFMLIDAYLWAFVSVAVGIAGAVVAFVLISGMDPISSEAVELKAKLGALRRWLKDFTRLGEAIPTDVVLWNRLLVMATALGVAKEVIDQLRVAAPQVLEDDHMAPVYGWYLYDASRRASPARAFNDAVTSAHQVSTAALASSSDSDGGGGGGGFSGGGGGGFGGGGGGGAF